MNIDYNPVDYISAGEAALMLGVTRGTILRWSMKGYVGRRKVGLKHFRYSVEDLMKMISAKK